MKSPKAKRVGVAAAYKEFKKLNIHRFPINIFSIYKHYKIPLVSYTQALKQPQFYTTIKKLKKKKVDAYCYHSGHAYIVFYDDGVDSPARIPFTLAHELGHIVLKHHYYTTGKTIERYAVLKNKYDWREVSADSFAGALLRPAVLIKILNLLNSVDIQDVFGVSKQCADLGLKFSKECVSSQPIHRFIAFINQQFGDFIHTYYCRRCQSTFVLSNNSYCPICRNENPHWFHEGLAIFDFDRNEKGCVNIMNYNKPETTDGYLVTRCLKCDNEDIHPQDQYCPICQTPTRNKCTGLQNSDLGSTRTACNAFLPPHYRYCPSCGNKSLYFSENLLKPWGEEKRENEIPF